jgi:hypothetical protein
MVGAIAITLLNRTPPSPGFKRGMYAFDDRTAHLLKAERDWKSVAQTAGLMISLEPNAFAPYALRGQAECVFWPKPISDSDAFRSRILNETDHGF